MEPGLIFGAASALIGAGSLGLSVTPYLRVRSRSRDLRNALAAIQRTPAWGRSHDRHIADARVGDPRHWDRLAAWLDIGDLLMEPLRARVLGRAMAIAAATAGGVLAISYDFPNHWLSSDLGSLELHDFGVVLCLIIANVAAFMKKHLLSQPEADFLQNFNRLSETFYRREIVPKIEDFNYECATFFNQGRDENADELVQLRSSIESNTKRIEELSSQGDSVR